ncbi:hypothetical protein BKG93_05905 [Rodentibacter ratti]|uniref:YubB ferredoxin-like domain-containing protein n=2 Tax=Rodentibacter TaxID=1960084 RepID=A0A1V3L4C0_9PAST|nr:MULTISPECIES: hypothetical protein [Rodentibacter]OOF79685.1 hypothetical protein BKG96_01420 [Rodentibacter heylii]OOF84787.1 hypothetical protein BKG93_05905 [Rodentibacter ratti]QIA76772.1 hypothetical protein FEE42_05070 [Rodentibacter heylii]
MPDWCKNKLTVRGSEAEIDAIKPFLFGKHSRTGELEVDFNALNACPESLSIPFTDDATRAQILLMLPEDTPLRESFIQAHFNDEDANVAHLLMEIKHHNIKTIGELIKWFMEDNEREFKHCLDLKLGQQYIANLIQFGQETGHDWHEKHWGTNLNAETRLIDDEGTEVICFFDMTCSEPKVWFELLCQRFPHVEWVFEYFSINGFYAGKIHFKDKIFSYQYFSEYSEVGNFAYDVFDYIDGDEK